MRTLAQLADTLRSIANELDAISAPVIQPPVATNPSAQSRGVLQTICADEDGPILQAVRVNGVPWLYLHVHSTDFGVAGVGANIVTRCHAADGTFTDTTIQPGLAYPGQGCIDFAVAVDGVTRIMSISGRQGPSGPGLLADAPGFWEIGSSYAPFKVWGS